MFSRLLGSSSRTDLPPNDASTVVLINESYWKSMESVKQSGQLYLCKTYVHVDDSPHRPPFEIIYRSSKVFSLCRIVEQSLAEQRFDCLKNIANIMFHPTNPNRNTPFITKAFQKVVNTCVEHPNWLDVHISAYNGFVDFFKKTDLNIEQINAQTKPDMCTPLHLAILRGFIQTVKAILAFEPNITLLDSESNSILHYAVMSKLEIMEIILQLPHIRNLIVRNRKHWNPIELTCHIANKDILQRLMSFGLTVQMLTLAAEPGKPIEENTRQMLNQLNNERMVKFSNEFINEFDMNLINQGGCPLHWIQTKNAIEKLIKDGFNINTTNWHGEVPLTIMVKKNLFKNVLTMLCNGANVNYPDCYGDTPLVIAIRNGNVNLVRLMLIFDGNVNQKIFNGQTIRHLVATGSSPNSGDQQEILSMLISLGAVPCEPNVQWSCAKGCIENGNLIDHYLEFPFNFNSSHYIMMNNLLNETIHMERKSMKCKKKRIKLACFDGGGVRGIFTVQMMIELNRYLQYDFSKYFQWISGTSTGSMITFALTQGKPLAEIRKLYFQFKDQVMTGTRPYRSDILEELFRRELNGTIPLREIKQLYGKNTLIMATRIDRSPPSLHMFRSYSFPGVDQHNDPTTSIKSWKTLRASAAAPTFFRSYPPFIDGGFLSNNPTIDSLTEYFRYQCAIKRYNNNNPKERQPESELQMVISFGTGQLAPANSDLSEVYNKLQFFLNLQNSLRDLNRAPWTLNELLTQVRAQVTNCNEQVVYRSDSWCSALNVPYFRLNPILSKKYPLNEIDDLELIRGLWDVKVYAYHKSSELKQLARLIDYLDRTAN